MDFELQLSFFAFVICTKDPSDIYIYNSYNKILVSLEAYFFFTIDSCFYMCKVLILLSSTRHVCCCIKDKHFI